MRDHLNPDGTVDLPPWWEDLPEVGEFEWAYWARVWRAHGLIPADDLVPLPGTWTWTDHPRSWRTADGDAVWTVEPYIDAVDPAEFRAHVERFGITVLGYHAGCWSPGHTVLIMLRPVELPVDAAEPVVDDEPEMSDAELWALMALPPPTDAVLGGMVRKVISAPTPDDRLALLLWAAGRCMAYQRAGHFTEPATRALIGALMREVDLPDDHYPTVLRLAWERHLRAVQRHSEEAA
jgi:hypothetical protein